MQYLKADTEITVRIGPFLDDTDGKTAETGLTITQPDIRLSKAGGDFAQKNAAETLVHDENGWYILTLDTTDTNTEGRLDVAIHESGALPVWREFMVVNANVFDSLFAAATTDYLQVDTSQWLGTAVTLSTGNKPDVNIDEISDDTTAPGNLELMYDGTGYAGGTTKLSVNVASQANIDFGSIQKASIETAVNAQLTAANTELAAIPTSIGGLRSMIQFIFEYFRNKREEVAATETLYKEDASTPLGTRTLADDGTTFTRGEMST